MSMATPAAPSSSNPPIVQRLFTALTEFANANGFQVGSSAALHVAQIAANNIQKQSFNDAAREAGVQTAITALPQVAAQVRLVTIDTNFPDIASVNALMAAKVCDCPWPWGNGP